jgi:hypothetical protein
MQAEPVLDKTGRPTGVYTYEGGVANRGLELIGKNLGMFEEKQIQGGDTIFNTVNFFIPINDRDPRESNNVPSSGDGPTVIGNGHGEV